VALTGATSRQPGRVAAGALAADSTPQSCQQGWQEEATFFQDQAGWQATIRALAVASVVVYRRGFLQKGGLFTVVEPCPQLSSTWRWDW
jgi:hypothetical protein